MMDQQTMFPCRELSRELNPGRELNPSHGGETARSQPLDHIRVFGATSYSKKAISKYLDSCAIREYIRKN